MLTRGDVGEALELREQLVAAAERKRLKRLAQESRFLRRRDRRRAFLRALGPGWWLVALLALGLALVTLAGCGTAAAPSAGDRAWCSEMAANVDGYDVAGCLRRQAAEAD